MLLIIGDPNLLQNKHVVSYLMQNLNGESPNHHGRIGTRLRGNSDKMIQEQTATRLTLL